MIIPTTCSSKVTSRLHKTYHRTLLKRAVLSLVVQIRGASGESGHDPRTDTISH
eukprot:m.93580 g.93580  ORF g.93580 m.93580 type:complete len:54 (-) comp13002_c0_seq4:474-635(-)